MRTRYALVTCTLLAAMAVERWRGTPWVIVISGGAAFLLAGNWVVYRSGAEARARRRQQELDYWTQ
jgi:hypothetical protein